MHSEDPNWWRQACVYEIYPRSFADANGDGIGDLKGITSRVDYLARLGIDAVWLSPFYTSPLADGGYPKIGTLDDFDEMTTAFKKAGIKVIVDIVPNHASEEHPWFEAALKAPKGSKERERFIFRDGHGPHGEEPPNDWQCFFGGSAWDPAGDGQWYFHLFASEQPDWNWDNPEVRDDFRKTLRFWGDRGVSGFRVDAAPFCVKNIYPPYISQVEQIALNKRVMQGDRSEQHPWNDRDAMPEVYEEWRLVFNEYDPPLMAVGEISAPPERLPRYATSKSLGQAFAFDVQFADCTAAQYHEVIAQQLSVVKMSGSTSTWVLSTHDAIRHATRHALPDLALGRIAGWEEWLDLQGKAVFGENAKPVDAELGRRKARMATMVILGLPGSAYLYQGEELGLPEVIDIPDADRQDPMFMRGMSKGRDGCRIPLPWTKDGPSFGFGPTAKSHLPQPKDWGKFAVEEQDKTEGSTLKLYQKVLATRKSLLQDADETLEWIESSKDVLHFKRGEWQVFANFGAEEVDLPAGEVLVASNKVDTKVPHRTTVWLKA